MIAGQRDPLALATALSGALDSAPDTRTLLPLLEPLLEALRAREGLLPWIVAVDPADRPGFREIFEAGFNAFWSVYPIKVGKLKARKAAYRAARSSTWPGWDRCIEAVVAQKLTPRWQGGTIPNPETWFNGGRWDDEPATMTAIGKVAELKASGEERQRRWDAENGYYGPTWGRR